MNSASELELENFGIVRATHPRAIIITIISRSIATNRLFCCERWKKKKEGRSQHRLEWGNSNTLRALGSPRASCYKIRSHCNNSTADEGWTARRTMCVTRSPAGPCDDASQDNDQFQHRWRRSNNQRTFFQELRMRAEELKVQKVAQGKTKNKKRVKTLYIYLYIIIIRRKKKKGENRRDRQGIGRVSWRPRGDPPPILLTIENGVLFSSWRMEKDKRTNQNRKFWIKKKHQLLTPIKAKGGKQKTKKFWTRFDLIRRRDMYHLLFFFFFRNGRAKPFHLHSADVIWWGSFVHFLPIGSPRRPISLSKKRRDMAKKEEKTTHTRPLSLSLCCCCWSLEMG